MQGRSNRDKKYILSLFTDGKIVTCDRGPYHSRSSSGHIATHSVTNCTGECTTIIALQYCRDLKRTTNVNQIVCELLKWWMEEDSACCQIDVDHSARDVDVFLADFCYQLVWTGVVQVSVVDSIINAAF